MNPQPVDQAKLKDQKNFILKKVGILEGLAQFGYLQPHLLELQVKDGLALLYSPTYSQVLSHGDLNETNLLVDEGTSAITGIIDWSSAKIASFGLELAALRRLGGNMNENGWVSQLYERDIIIMPGHEFMTGIEANQYLTLD